jgi:hypothetical protein
MKIKNLLFGIINIVLFSCSTSKKIETLKPEPSKNAPIVYSNKTSLISMPMEVSLKEVEYHLNKNVKGLIYADTILNDDKTEMNNILKVVVGSKSDDDSKKEVPF